MNFPCPCAENCRRWNGWRQRRRIIPTIKFARALAGVACCFAQKESFMRYQITGKQIDIGESLQSHVQASLGEVLNKYAGRPTDANIVFSKSGHEFVCETIVHLSTGLTSQARAHATEIYTSFDGCIEKMDKQLRRYKRRLKDHHRDRTSPVELLDAASYISPRRINLRNRSLIHSSHDHRRDGIEDSFALGRRRLLCKWSWQERRC